MAVPKNKRSKAKQKLRYISQKNKKIKLVHYQICEFCKVRLHRHLTKCSCLLKRNII